MVDAGPAQAATEWHGGTNEHSYVGNCNFQVEPGIDAYAQFQADQQALPRVGDVFYVRTIAGRVGSGCGIDMKVHVEIVPPVGVSAAISSTTPVRCILENFVTGEVTHPSGCPQEAQQGVYGNHSFDQLTPGGANPTSPWTVPYEWALIVEVPMRSTRELKGGGGGTPSCGRSEGEPPCTAEQSGDSLQFANWVIDGWDGPWLSPWVSLFVAAADTPPPAAPPAAPAPAGGSGPAGGSRPTPTPAPNSTAPGTQTPAADLIASAPRVVRLQRLRRGIPITARVGASGSTVRATLTMSGRTIARATTRGASAGTVPMRIKPTRAVARRLRLRRPTTATLRVEVTAPDGNTRSATRRITVKR
jgi:hypothetical protein